MKVKSKVRAGIDGVTLNHNQTVQGLRVKTKVKAGADGINPNHNQTVEVGREGSGGRGVRRT